MRINKKQVEGYKLYALGAQENWSTDWLQDTEVPNSFTFKKSTLLDHHLGEGVVTSDYFNSVFALLMASWTSCGWKCLPTRERHTTDIFERNSWTHVLLALLSIAMEQFSPKFHVHLSAARFQCCNDPSSQILMSHEPRR